MSVERLDGPTPGGGAYAEVLRDDEGRVLEITEYDAAGGVIARTYAARAAEVDSGRRDTRIPERGSRLGRLLGRWSPGRGSRPDNR